MLLRQNAGWLFALLVFFSGCATVAMNAGFDDVKATVEERSASRIFWNNGTELDKEAAEKVDSLLKTKLTADEAVQIALLNNRDLQAVYSDLGVAQADLVQAGLLNNPIFEAAIKFPTSGGQANLEFITVMNFLDVFYMPLRKRVAAARFEEAKLRVTGAVLDFAARARTAFYLHLANEQMLELRQTIVQALNASLEVARRLNEAGNITDLDLARERALAEAGKLALRSAEIAVRQSREQLNDLMGLWGKNTEWQADGRLPDIPGQPMQTEDIERRCAQPEHRFVPCPAAHCRRGRAVGIQQDNGFDPGVALRAVRGAKRRCMGGRAGTGISHSTIRSGPGPGRACRGGAQAHPAGILCSGDSDSLDGSRCSRSNGRIPGSRVVLPRHSVAVA